MKPNITFFLLNIFLFTFALCGCKHQETASRQVVTESACFMGYEDSGENNALYSRALFSQMNPKFECICILKYNGTHYDVLYSLELNPENSYFHGEYNRDGYDIKIDAERLTINESCKAINISLNFSENDALKKAINTNVSSDCPSEFLVIDKFDKDRPIYDTPEYVFILFTGKKNKTTSSSGIAKKLANKDAKYYTTAKELYERFVNAVKLSDFAKAVASLNLTNNENAASKFALFWRLTKEAGADNLEFGNINKYFDGYIFNVKIKNKRSDAIEEFFFILYISENNAWEMIPFIFDI